jgi:hypothetical protein
MRALLADVQRLGQRIKESGLTRQTLVGWLAHHSLQALRRRHQHSTTSQHDESTQQLPQYFSSSSTTSTALPQYFSSSPTSTTPLSNRVGSTTHPSSDQLEFERQRRVRYIQAILFLVFSIAYWKKGSKLPDDEDD